MISWCVYCHLLFLGIYVHLRQYVTPPLSDMIKHLSCCCPSVCIERFMKWRMEGRDQICHIHWPGNVYVVSSRLKVRMSSKAKNNHLSLLNNTSILWTNKESKCAPILLHHLLVIQLWKIIINNKKDWKPKIIYNLCFLSEVPLQSRLFLITGYLFMICLTL